MKRNVLALAGAVMTMMALTAMPAAADCTVAWKAGNVWNAAPAHNVLTYTGVGCPVAKAWALADCKTWGYGDCTIEDSTDGRGMCITATGGILPNGQPFLFTNKVRPVNLQLSGARCFAYAARCNTVFLSSCNPS